MGEHHNKGSKEFLRLRLLELSGLLLAAAGLYVFLALVTFNVADPSYNNATSGLGVHNAGGAVGAYVSDLLLQYFGLGAFTLPAVAVFYAFYLLTHRSLSHMALRLATVPLFILALSVGFELLPPLPDWPSADQVGNGGLVGKLLAMVGLQLFGLFGVSALALILSMVSLLWLSGLTLLDVYHGVLVAADKARFLLMQAGRLLKRVHFKKALQFDLPLAQAPRPKPKLNFKPKVKPMVERASKQELAGRVEKERQAALPIASDTGNVELPALHILEDGDAKQEGESEEALQQNARQIEAQLKNFGIEGQVTKICPGPVITIYELEPAPGVKTSQVVNLSDDLARAMSAVAVRVAPIPGRTVIGIELPNRKRKSVTLKELLSTEAFETHPGKLTVALGVDTSGVPIYADVAKMPHALIAGTTGSGKSVAMNAFILSLLYRMGPDDLKFIMIDPKMLELSIYNEIPHLLTPVVTDPNKAAVALKWVVKEMERRYKLMSEVGVKNLQSFNVKMAEFRAKDEMPMREVQDGFDPHTGQPKFRKEPMADGPIPYMVVVIDELADLMMVAGKEVEMYIARIAQMARAAGIHLLVATQRPSVDVVTGLIKANIPTRMSFSVTSKIDSRTVLDQMGAEQLLGKGDMLYMGNGSTGLQRLHGAFVSEEECTQVAQFLKKQGQPQYLEEITKPQAGEGSGGGGGGDVADDDPLYQQAVEIVAKEQKASTSFVQRHLKIGYNRAASLIDKMEADGFIGPANHVGKREVIIRQPPEGGY